MQPLMPIPERSALVSDSKGQGGRDRGAPGDSGGRGRRSVWKKGLFIHGCICLRRLCRAIECCNASKVCLLFLFPNGFLSPVSGGTSSCQAEPCQGVFSYVWSVRSEIRDQSFGRKVFRIGSNSGVGTCCIGSSFRQARHPLGYFMQSDKRPVMAMPFDKPTHLCPAWSDPHTQSGALGTQFHCFLL